MTKTTSRHLLNILAEVPDFRNNRGKRHPLSAILGLAVIAMMCGYRSYTAIAEWGRTYHPDHACTFETLHHEAEAHTDTFSCVENEHGFITSRTLTTSTLLNDYLNSPDFAQVYQYQSQRKNRRTGEITCHRQYGITSLPPDKANAQDLLNLRRGHWTIENLSRRTRDVTFREDASQVRCGNIPQVMAALRNTVITLLRISGHRKIEKAQRFFATHPWQTFKILQKTKFDN